MSRNHFEKLRNNLHLAIDKPDGNEDRLWKVRPIVNCMKSRSRDLQLEENLCIDEQIIPFRGNLNIKQYIKNKPNPWGVKAYLLCGESGLVYDFIVYQGKTTPLKPELTKNFGVTGAVVLQLSERITNNENYKLYADNFFTSIDIIRHLLQKGIFYSGTIRKNRMRKCPLVTKKNEKRGAINEIVTGDDKIVITQWSDNKVVYMASSLVGKGETGVVECWSKTEKKFVNVVRPEVAKCYNSSMGGVDKTDFLVQLYRIFIHSRKWTLKSCISFHKSCNHKQLA